MIVLVFINVTMHAFGKDMAATTEMCELLMVWVTFLGGAAANGVFADAFHHAIELKRQRADFILPGLLGPHGVVLLIGHGPR